MSVKPITPKEAHEQFCTTQIPDFIFEVVNELLTQKASQPNCNIDIKQNKIVQRIIKHPNFPKNLSTQSIFDNGWLNIEPLYKEAGWEIIYDKPAYNESYDAYFTFKPTKS